MKPTESERENGRFWINDDVTITTEVDYQGGGVTGVMAEGWVQIVDDRAGGIAYAHPMHAERIINALDNAFVRLPEAIEMMHDDKGDWRGAIELAADNGEDLSA